MCNNAQQKEENKRKQKNMTTLMAKDMSKPAKRTKTETASLADVTYNT
jgi:hypothetical protein